MHKRPHSDSEVSAEEADSSEISKPATKIIRVDDSPRSSSDKCIQVDSAAEATGEPGGLPGPSTSAITNSNVDAATAEEDNAIDLVSSNTNHSSTSTETTIRCSNNDASTDDPTTITTSTTTSSTTATSSSSSIDDTCEPSCDIAPSHDETPSASPNSTEPTSSIEEGEIYQDQPLNEDAVTVDDAVIEEVPSYAEEQAVATSSSSVNASLDEPDMTPSTSSGIRHVPSRRTQSILKTAERKLKGKRSVVFNGVTVYYFRRSQGFTCIPSQGGSTLGMENSHTYIRNFTLETHAEERKRAHREILQRQRRFARMNKHSSTSESEDDSYDDMSDLSDVDLENDNCYFLQPVPIKQRRALLRASGVRKIETSEKEECRDIRISREFCGCECQVYCNPEICACYLAGIKCQVDRMAFPCGCSKDGCHNENGRIEFNPMRVRTHFIHTIMKIEMEKKQEQQQQQQQQQQMASSTSNGGGMISTISSTDGAYCGAPCTSSYSSPISNQCSQSMQQGMYAMPMVHNNTAHSGHHYISESSHMHLMPPNNSYADPNIYHTNEYSPDSSYSENSDYTTGSDEFENENGEKTDDSPVNVVTSHEMYNQHQHQQQQQQQQPHPSSHQYASNGQDMMHSCANSNALPPFPSINSSCDLSAGGTGYTKNGHCHSYQQDSGGANSMHLNHYNSYSAMTDSLPQPPQQQQPSQHASLYSYDIHSSSSHYTSYSNGFHKGEPNFASMGTGNVAVATTSHLSAETSPPLEHPQQQHQHQHQQQQQQQQPVNSSSQQQMVGSEGNSIAAPAPQQQYIDLSLSIASSSSAESLLSAANTSDEDSRLTPVSFTHIQPLSSSSSFYTVVTNNSSSLGHHPYDHQDYSAKGTSDHHLLPQCSSIAVSAPYGELSEADPKSSSSSSDSSSESNLSSSDNFGEIIKKSIVETVSA